MNTTIKDVNYIFTPYIQKNQIYDIINVFKNNTTTTNLLVKGVYKTSICEGSRGLHYYDAKTNQNIIELSEEIKHSFLEGNKIFGGDVCRVENLRQAFACTFLHEFCHMQQWSIHCKNNSFYKGKYRSKACEIDARNFVDNNFYILKSILNEHDALSASKNKDNKNKWFEL